MKKLNLLFSASIFALLLMSCSPSPEKTQTPESNVEKTDSSEVKAAYVCPMGAECGSSDKPGDCTGCGMKLLENK